MKFPPQKSFLAITYYFAAIGSRKNALRLLSFRVHGMGPSHEQKDGRKNISQRVPLCTEGLWIPWQPRKSNSLALGHLALSSETMPAKTVKELLDLSGIRLEWTRSQTSSYLLSRLPSNDPKREVAQSILVGLNQTAPSCGWDPALPHTSVHLLGPLDRLAGPRSSHGDDRGAEGSGCASYITGQKASCQVGTDPKASGLEDEIEDNLG
ncbi:uncharacterized protein LOC109496468 isoform X2 [Felis catus]|uniref:uncharacterized protein LOC109496468 isoform X2 n=1 Tax=Felis catus TaxID=9685 RepID=UPI001D19D9C5|nr:uncharacterized protein LOC109496468 isoform X2 [Felis catus]